MLTYVIKVKNLKWERHTAVWEEWLPLRKNKREEVRGGVLGLFVNILFLKKEIRTQ